MQTLHVMLAGKLITWIFNSFAPVVVIIFIATVLICIFQSHQLCGWVGNVVIVNYVKAANSLVMKIECCVVIIVIKDSIHIV